MNVLLHYLIKKFNSIDIDLTSYFRINFRQTHHLLRVPSGKAKGVQT